MALNDGTVMDLDRLIQSCEFENKQYVKLIEKENQQTEAYEREIEERERETFKLEAAISQLDEDTKRAHKQFTLNRDNCESLRKTMVVLMEHEVALNRKLNCLIANGEDERLQHEGVVKHYEDIYADYMVKYKTFPLVKDLAVYREQIAAKEQILQATEDKINTLKRQIDEAQGGSEVSFKNLNKFIIKLAEMKLDTEHAVLEKTQFEAELGEIQEKHSRQEEETDVIARQGTDEQPANISDDSFGEDMSTMIGIYNNKAETGVNINNSAEIQELTVSMNTQSLPACDVVMKSIHQQASTPQLTTAEEIPVTRMSEIHINASLLSPSLQTRAPPSSPAEQNITPVPVANDSTQSRVSPLVMRMGTQSITTPTSHSPQSTSFRSPQAVFMPSFISKETKSQLHPGHSRSFIPKTVHSPQIPHFPKSTSVPALKVKHGVNSIQSSGKQSGPSLVIPVREQKRHSASVPRLPIVLNQIRVPAKQAPVPPSTPEGQKSTEAVGASRFLSPISEPQPHHYPSYPNLTAPRKLDAGPVGHPMSIVEHTSTTPVTSHHFDKPGEVSGPSKSPQEAPDNVVMESPDRSKPCPTTPGQTVEYQIDPESPFDLEKHLQKVNSLAKSPGGPMYTQRPMFTGDGAQIESKSPGPFLQTFSSGETHSLNKSSSDGRSEVDQLMSSMFSSSPDTPLSGNLFQAQDKTDHPETAETSFIFSRGSERSDRSSSFLSMFESPTRGARTPQNFSFNFGSDNTPTPNKSDFAFSFGSGGGEDRSPSIFNLF
ncbi:uncharacterized protein LOC124271898 [Haliotis rubra]|uniref:uncharacterized protein LOC124271898 n=1 Tax=Haliotis rubra TaxID=36100 RepID=UPI001EE4FCAF|nr:uncharacterized protein LOC124271898 [Haliotis rubra]XP_046563024.1 uncharacterized protein LOC124271898 [Haliotis rubra]